MMTRDIHAHYDRLTDEQRAIIDNLFRELYPAFKAIGVLLDSGDPAERAVDAVAAFVLESAPPVPDGYPSVVRHAPTGRDLHRTNAERYWRVVNGKADAPWVDAADDRAFLLNVENMETEEIFGDMWREINDTLIKREPNGNVVFSMGRGPDQSVHPNTPVYTFARVPG